LTVCIAAICEKATAVVGASDRMITSGDVEFELSGTDESRPVLKTLQVAPHIAMMTAGDAGFQGDIVHLISLRTAALGRGQQLRVRDFALMYTDLLNEARQRIILNRILSPLSLDNETFISRQNEMRPEFVSEITEAILQFQINAEALFVGLDDTGAHIYQVDDTGMTCCDAVGFAAIGSGARHAESQFMLANHSRHGSTVDAMLLAYIAKKRSEVAPGVGEDTDLFFISAKHGFNWVFKKEDIAELEDIYDRMETSQAAAFLEAKIELGRRVDEEWGKQQADKQPPPTSLPPDSE
jgi:20S proteasome alpha/beta subunit